MKIKKISWIIAGLSLLLVLVLVRAFNTNLFKRPAIDAITATENNTVTVSQLQLNSEPRTIIELDENNQRFNESMSIPFSQLLEKDNQLKLKGAQGNIYLHSTKAETSAKAWVILNQLGYDNILILTDEQPEVLKYKFRPDTIVQPE